MDFPEKISSLRNQMGLTQDEMAVRLGVKRNYISLLERGAKEPSDILRRHVELIERSLSLGIYPLKDQALRKVQEDAAVPSHFKDPRRHDRRIPVLSWAHAGEAIAYEEMPFDPDDTIPTDCPDPHAFGLRLQGDSMQEIAKEGAMLVVMPTRQAHSGSLAVVRLATDGVQFRRVEFKRDSVLLIPANDRYRIDELPRAEIAWIYPVWGIWTQTWI